MYKFRRYGWAFLAWLGCWTGGVAAARGDVADVVLYGGRIVTVDSTFQVAEAMAVQDERILEVGTDAAVLQRAGTDTLRIDLEGRTVLPGLIDTHSHPVSASLANL